MPKSDQISEIINLIFRMRQLMHERIENDRDEKISLLQMITLCYIQKRNPLMKDIAEYLLITPPSATSLLNSIISAGLAKRESEKNDRRIVRIKITKKGEEHIKNNYKKISMKIRKNLEVLDKKEQKQLSEILKKITRTDKSDKA